MKMVTCLLTALVLASPSAHAADAKASSALALATIVAGHSPTLGTPEKRLLRRMFNGRSNVKYQGKISVESQPGQGTTFVIDLSVKQL